MPLPMPDPAPEIDALQHRHLLGLATYSAEEIRLILRTAREFRAVLDRPVKRVPSAARRHRRQPLLRGEHADAALVRARREAALGRRRQLLGERLVGLEGGDAEGHGAQHRGDEDRHGRHPPRVARRGALPHAVDRLRRAQRGRRRARAPDAGAPRHAHARRPRPPALPRHEQLHRGHFDGLNVSIIGDITHSRVARSNIHGLQALGANVTLCGPRTMMPRDVEQMGVRVVDRLDAALDGCDVAMALRIQLERQTGSKGGLFPSLREYHERYGIKESHLAHYPDLRIMHPGPVNRGVELASEVVDSDRSVILNQVTNGVAVRMACLYLLSGGTRRARRPSGATLMNRSISHPSIIVGWREWVALPDLGLPAVKAKVDTGRQNVVAPRLRHRDLPRGRARARPLRRPPIAGERAARRVGHGRRRGRALGHEFERARRTARRDPHVAPPRRSTWPIELTLTDRRSMRLRMLLGREALERPPPRRRGRVVPPRPAPPPEAALPLGLSSSFCPRHADRHPLAQPRALFHASSRRGGGEARARGPRARHAPLHDPPRRGRAGAPPATARRSKGSTP